MHDRFTATGARHRLALAAGVVVGVTSPALAQRADGFRVDRFEMAATVEDGLVVQVPETLGHLRWNANLTLGLAAPTLIVTPGRDIDQGFDVVGTRLTSYLGFALGLARRFEVDAQLPVALYQSSDGGAQGAYTIPAVGSTALGDLRLSGSAFIAGRRGAGFQLGGTASLYVPTGAEDELTGDGSVAGALLADVAYLTPRVRLVANAGIRLRPGAEFVTSDQGHELIARGGVLVPLVDGRLVASAELDAGVRVTGDDAFDHEGSPVLALLGARYHAGAGVYVGGGIGAGLTLAPGSPTYRALATIGYMPEPEEAAPPPAPPPVPPPPTPVDNDGDGLLDRDDRCPQQPEDKDHFEDEDGCPDLDNDGDKIVDVDDQCPRVDGETVDQTAEIYNRYQDEDGCPDKVLTLEEVVSLPAPIEFEYDKAILLPGSDLYLEAVLHVLEQQPKARLEVQGHTSSEGGVEYNQKLSDARAQAVVTWLTSRGIAPARLVAKGYGLTQPLVPNDTEENRQKNRRVVFVLLNPKEVIR